ATSPPPRSRRRSPPTSRRSSATCAERPSRIHTTDSHPADGRGGRSDQNGVVGPYLPSDPSDLLADAQFAVPDDVPGLLSAHARRLGALDAAIFLVDYGQRVLTPLPRPGGPDRQSVAVEGTLAGRAFSTLSLQWNGDRTLLWVPMVEGNERLGVIGFELPAAEGGGGVLPAGGAGADDLVEAAVRLTAQ